MGLLEAMSKIGSAGSKSKKRATASIRRKSGLLFSAPTADSKKSSESSTALNGSSKLNGCNNNSSTELNAQLPQCQTINDSTRTPPYRLQTTPDESLLVQLAQTITKETALLATFLQFRGEHLPTFKPDGITDYTHLSPEANSSRNELLDAISSLHDLVLGPTEKLRWLAWDFSDQLSLSFINYHRIASLFPVDSTMTISAIAVAIGVDETNVARLIRHAITNRIFVEVSSGVIAHTAASRVLAEDRNMYHWVGFTTEDIFPASAATLTAMKLNPSSQEPTQAGFQVANGTLDVEPLWATLGRNPERAKRFGAAMTSLTGGEGYEVSYLIEGVSRIWNDIDSTGGTVVDVGGSHGAVDVMLANHYKNTKYVVQDLAEMISNAPALGNERIRFMTHDFFTEQPVKGADVYLFRWIFHNQSTKYSLLILRALIPAMKPGARILINDNVLPELNQDSLHDEKITRSMDLVMLTLLNAQERTKADFEKLFEMADKRFKLGSITREKGSLMSVVEAVWEGGDMTVENKVVQEVKGSAADMKL